MFGYFFYYLFNKKEGISEGNYLLNNIKEKEVKKTMKFEENAIKVMSNQSLQPIATHMVIYAKKLLPKYNKTAIEDMDILSKAINEVRVPSSTYTYHKQPKEYNK